MPYSLNGIAFLWEQENLKERVLVSLNSQTSLLMGNQQLGPQRCIQKRLPSWWPLGSRKITKENPVPGLTNLTNPNSGIRVTSIICNQNLGFHQEKTEFKSKPFREKDKDLVSVEVRNELLHKQSSGLSSQARKRTLLWPLTKGLICFF